MAKIPSFGEEPAFAAGNEDGWQYGMTYRQWLVGQAMSGLLSRDGMSIEDAVALAFAAAQMAIQRMDDKCDNLDQWFIDNTKPQVR